MIRTFVPMFGVIGLIAGLGWAAGTGSPHIAAVAVAMVMAIVVAMIASVMPNDEDRPWLPSMIMTGFTAKIIASWVRWWVLVDFYGGSGDAQGYHGAGVQLAPVWRSLSTPEDLKIGTFAMDAISGLAYFFFIPNLLGGFFIFATLSFFGQLFFYSAFRAAPIKRNLKRYALIIFFVPNIIYWPSSIGKESVMILGIGAASYGVARLLKDGTLTSLFPIVFGLLLAGVVRPHVAGLVAVAATLALLLAKGPGVAEFPAKRLTLLVFVGAGLSGLILVSAANFGINLESLDELDTSVDDFVGTVEDNTTKGGSSVEGGFIKNPLDFPEAALKVLFRPLPNEAHNAPAFASSIEGTLLLLLFIWRLPWIARRLWGIRRDPFTMFVFFYTIGFVIAFSAFNNLGLMARERSQVMPFFLAWVLTLGWPDPVDDEGEAEEEAVPAFVTVGVYSPTR